MKNQFKRCLATVALMALSAVLLVAADASGTWKGSFDINGTAVPVTLNLKADGDKVSGTVNGPTGASDIKDGKVDGDSITFSSTTAYQGMSIKVLYKGKIASDQITFTMATEDGAWSIDLVVKRDS